MLEEGGAESENGEDDDGEMWRWEFRYVSKLRFSKNIMVVVDGDFWTSFLLPLPHRPFVHPFLPPFSIFEAMNRAQTPPTP